MGSQSHLETLISQAKYRDPAHQLLRPYQARPAKPTWLGHLCLDRSFQALPLLHKRRVDQGFPHVSFS